MKRRALIGLVEDNLANQVMVARRLEKMDYLVTVASDGQAGVTMAQHEPVDLVLMDLDLPILTGKQAALEIRQTPGLGQLPIIALTANVLAEQDTPCDDVFNAFVSKPIDFPQLLRLIEQWTERTIDDGA